MALPVYPTAHRFAGCARLNIVVVAVVVVVLALIHAQSGSLC